jgi:hypothetical protein
LLCAHEKHPYRGFDHPLFPPLVFLSSTIRFSLSSRTPRLPSSTSPKLKIISHTNMSKTAAQKATPVMEPPPPYYASPSASPRNSSDSLQLEEADAETQPLNLEASTAATPDASDARVGSSEPNLDNGGCCNIYSRAGCCNFDSDGGCCNFR